MKRRKLNVRVVVYSIIALICLALSYLVHWVFLIPVAVLIYLNQKEIMKGI